MTGRTPSSRLRKSRRVLGALAAAWLCGAAPVSAACTVSLVSNVSFGSYNVFGASPLDSTGQFRWRCDAKTFPTVRITLTPGGGASYRPRRMQGGGGGSLDYDLFLDAARTIVWGDESGGTQASYQQYSGSGWMQVTIYGRVPALQDASVGAYSDGVTIVVNY